MKLNLTLFLLLLPFMSPIPRSSSPRGRVRNWDKKLVLPEEQHPVETESQTSSWLCRFGLTTCSTKIKDKNNNQVLHEEQRSVETKSQASNWLCRFGLTTCPIKITDGKKNQVLPQEQILVETKSQTSSWLCRFGLSACPTEIEDENNNQVLPQEQHPVETKSQTSNWLCWFGLTTCPGNGDNKLVHPEERLPINTEAHASNWPFWLGLSPYLKWVPYEVSESVVPEGPKQQSLRTEQKAISLPDTLHHLWDVLKQSRITWHLKDHFTDYRIFRLLWVIYGIWRRMRRRQR